MTSIETPVTVAAQTVLIVDDDSALGSALAESLVGPGRDIIVCRDIESARMVLETRFISHIITDLRFSDTLGYEGLHIVDTVRRNLSAIPVVVVSAKELTADDRQRLQGHVLKILQKGNFGRDELMREVQQTVKLFLSSSNEQAT